MAKWLLTGGIPAASHQAQDAEVARGHARVGNRRQTIRQVPATLDRRRQAARPSMIRIGRAVIDLTRVAECRRTVEDTMTK